MKVIHIYAQPYEHAEAKIVGNKEGLIDLLKKITEAIQNGQSSLDNAWCTDGEGYEIKIIVGPDDWQDNEWQKYPPEYGYLSLPEFRSL
jgi:hypothetical protein